jgi:hypothetical protein
MARSQYQTYPHQTRPHQALSTTTIISLTCLAIATLCFGGLAIVQALNGNPLWSVLSMLTAIGNAGNLGFALATRISRG